MNDDEKMKFVKNCIDLEIKIDEIMKKYSSKEVASVFIAYFSKLIKTQGNPQGALDQVIDSLKKEVANASA